VFFRFTKVWLFLCLCPFSFAHAWENHIKCTRLALESVEGFEAAPFEPIEAVLPDLHPPGGMFLSSKEELSAAIKIHEDKIQWNWKPKQETALEVIAWSVQEPDYGMDREWHLADYQETMGGYTGLASQSIRHMVFPKFRLSDPIRTFHIPFHEMGQAHERAELFFDLALQAKKKNHLFWAYRFLGWGLHYVQDISQPYHDSQFASPKLLAIRKLFTSEGWKGFVAETTRNVGNFHIAFELYTDYLLDAEGTTGISQALRISRGTEKLKLALENDLSLSMRKGLELIIDTGNILAPQLADAEDVWIGDLLFDRKLDLLAGSRDALGNAKIDFVALQKDPVRLKNSGPLVAKAYEAISNTGIASRWYVERFLRLSSAVAQ
jgi:hypothetical protein